MNQPGSLCGGSSQSASALHALPVHRLIACSAALRWRALSLHSSVPTIQNPRTRAPFLTVQAMKNKLAFIALAFIFALSASAEAITLDEGRITFDAPDGFKPLPREIIAIKYPSSKAPKHVVGNESAATTIEYDIKQNSLPPEKLEKAKAMVVKTFTMLSPGIEWKEDKIIELAGRKWGYLEMISNKTNLHNIMLFTGYKGRMLLFKINSTQDEFPKYEKALQESLQSISIRE